MPNNDLDLFNVLLEKPIEKQLEDLKKSVMSELNRKEKRIQYLEQENKKLKEEYYKDNELQKLKELNDKYKEELRNGFPISKEEMKKIEEWKEQHLRDKHWNKEKDCCQYFGAIGGNFTYTFIPTSIGICGEIKCSCGEKFIFQELT